MKPIDVGEFAAKCGGSIQGSWKHQAFSGFALDNREVSSGDLFLAIRGARVDGHEFAADALAKGAAGCLVEKPVQGPHILVSNLVDALAAYAKSRRLEFYGPVVGITGSAGKTSTKEFVAAALSPLGKVLKSEGNRNTEYTCPLVWADLLPDHAAVVVELSMRGFGQIRHLASFCMPTVGVVTNIGYSHIELVGSRQGIAEAKSEIFESLPSSGHAVIHAQDPYAGFLSSRSRVPVATFGFGESDCRITSYQPTSWSSCTVEGRVGPTAWQATLPTVGKHMALNAACAVLVAHLVDVPVLQAAAALSGTQLPPMRMEVQEIAGVTFVNDTYNASPASTVAALETLGEMPCAGRKFVVLGEMRELGAKSHEGHFQVGEALATYPVRRAVLFGEATEGISEGASTMGFHDYQRVLDKSDIVGALGPLHEGDVVLLKGSRALELESLLDDFKERVN